MACAFVDADRLWRLYGSMGHGGNDGAAEFVRDAGSSAALFTRVGGAGSTGSSGKVYPLDDIDSPYYHGDLGDANRHVLVKYRCMDRF